MVDRASNSYWRSNFDTGSGLNTFGTTSPTGYAHADLLAAMHTMWRACQKNGGSPNFILCGTDFIKGYELAVDAKLDRCLLYTSPSPRD